MKRSIGRSAARACAVMVLLSSAALGCAAHAQGQPHAADEAAIKAVVQAFLDLREQNDAAGLAKLMTEDVDQQQTSGNLRRGRDAVVSGTLATQRTTGGRRTITLESIRLISPDVALADGRYDSLGRADGTDRHMLTSMVLKRERGGWKIAAIRNALPTMPETR